MTIEPLDSSAVGVMFMRVWGTKNCKALRHSSFVLSSCSAQRYKAILRKSLINCPKYTLKRAASAPSMTR